MAEVAFITATVNRLEVEIKQLNAQRAALLRRLNELRRAVPPEILALVFHHSGEPLRLAAVCAHWHQVAWTTPALWTDIIPIPIRRIASHNDAALLDLYFSNAAALPVSLQIKLNRLTFSSSVPSEDILTVAFIKHSANIKALSCTSNSSIPLRHSWPLLVPKLASSLFPNLERLEISLHNLPFHPYDTPLFHAPKLHIVSLTGYHLPHEYFWNQLTVLHLSAITATQSLEALLRCPNLVEYRCGSPSQCPRPFNMPLRSRSPVTFSYLKDFEWTGLLDAWDVFLYTLVRMPNLRRISLGITHPISRPATDPLRIDFFRRFEHLAILDISVLRQAQEWLEIFPIVGSTLRDLRITGLRGNDEMGTLLRALTLSYDNGNDNGHLPHLRVLHVTLDVHPQHFNQLLDVLCSRRIRPISADPIENNWVHDHMADLDYWKCHTQLERAVVKCWPGGSDIATPDQTLVGILKDTGLDLSLEVHRPY